MNETEHGGSCSWSLRAGVWLGVLFGGSGYVMKKNVRRKAVKPGHSVFFVFVVATVWVLGIF
jgi:hypothetical protein